MIDYGSILFQFYREYLWQCRDVYDYDSILWQDGRIAAPTKQELDSKWEEYLLEKLKQERKEKIKSLLLNSDWAEMQSSQLLLENSVQWIDYRLELKKLLISKDLDSVLPEVPEKKWKT